MTITAYGFDGSLGEAEWAAMARYQSQGYPAVLGSGDFKVSIPASGTRQVLVAPGEAWADGVLVRSDAAVSLTLPDGGSTRWDAIVLRRDWTTNRAFVGYVQGGSSLVYPAGLTRDAGVTTADQVLALTEFTPGQSKLTAVRDTRVPARRELVASGVAYVSVPVGAVAESGLVSYGFGRYSTDRPRIRLQVQNLADPSRIAVAPRDIGPEGFSIAVKNTGSTALSGVEVAWWAEWVL